MVSAESSRSVSRATSKSTAKPWSRRSESKPPALTRRSRDTFGRYHSEHGEHDDRFMPIDVVAALESAARFPHVTAALADLRGITTSYDADRRNATSRGVNQDVVTLALRFALLMAEYNAGIGDGRISSNEAKRLLRETLATQQVLLDIKLNRRRARPALWCHAGRRWPFPGFAPSRRGEKLPPCGLAGRPAGLALRTGGFAPCFCPPGLPGRCPRF